MEGKRKQSTLKQTYYRSFLLFIVIPLVLVFVGAEVAVSYIIRSSTVETIPPWSPPRISWPAAFICGTGEVSMKDDIILPGRKTRQSKWFLRAVEHPNTTTLGCYDTSRTRLIRTPYFKNELVLVTAMAPAPYTNCSGEIQAVALFTVSQVGGNPPGPV